jgi:hypothetical protein
LPQAAMNNVQSAMAMGWRMDVLLLISDADFPGSGALLI